MPRRRRRKKKVVHPHFNNFLELLGSTDEVDRFIEYLYTMPGYVAYIEEDEIIMEKYKTRVVREGRHQYVVTREQDVLMWLGSRGLTWRK